jgi:hypothetical protein
MFINTQEKPTQKTPQIPGFLFPFFPLLLSWTKKMLLFLGFLYIFLLATSVRASHSRYATISWKHVSGNTVQVRIDQAWRRDFGYVLLFFFFFFFFFFHFLDGVRCEPLKEYSH